MHSEIEHGGTLEWEMGSEPSQWDKGFMKACFVHFSEPELMEPMVVGHFQPSA
jgi:hypothetical protein